MRWSVLEGIPPCWSGLLITKTTYARSKKEWMILKRILKKSKKVLSPILT